MSTERNQESVLVSRIADLRNLSANASKVQITPGRKVKASSRKKVATAAMNLRVGTSAAGFSFNSGGGSSFGGGFAQGQATNIYSPHLSTDFLELPQNRTERRAYYRHFYNNDPFVGQAIDLHTELPLSKLRLSLPKGKNPKRNREILRFFEDMVDRLNLLQVLIEATREYYIIGEAFLFAEDTPVEVPEEVYYEHVPRIDTNGEVQVLKKERPNAKELEEEYIRKHYKGWDKLIVLPPDQVRVEGYQFSDLDRIELIPDQQTANIVSKALAGDPVAIRQFAMIPEEIRNYLQEGQNIPLGTDPYEGSFAYQLARSKPSYQDEGVSILQRCLLPGTPVVVNRDGLVCLVPVEEVNSTTDLILTHKGNFKPFRQGSRLVQEEVLSLDIVGQPESLRMTGNHEVFRYNEEGVEELVQASDLRVGDLVKEVYVASERSLETLDLVQWWEDHETLDVSRLRHEEARSIRVRSSSLTSEGDIRVEFVYDQDDPNRTSSVQDRTRLYEWLKSLTAPEILSLSEVGSLLNLSKSQVGYYKTLLEDDLGDAFETCPDTRKTIWTPLNSDQKVPGAFEHRVETSSISSLPLNPDLMYVLGTWLGDGCAWQSKGDFLNQTSLTWTFGDDEEGRCLQSKVRGALERLFPNADITDDPVYSRNTNLALHLNDVLFSKFVTEEFGLGSSGKKLPSWVFDLPIENQLALISGLIDTDGHVRESSQGYPSVDVQLDNKTLIEQVHLLCNGLGITTSVKPVHRKARVLSASYETQNGTVTRDYPQKPKTYWRLTCTQKSSVYLCLKHSEVKRHRLSEVPDFSSLEVQENPAIYRRIREITPESYSGPVFSFGVDGDESHSAGFIGVHNCLRALVYRDKLRQAQTSIASRAMTPKRLIYAEDLDVQDVEELRDQVDLALLDPDYSIIANYQVNWEEISADSRLLNLSGEYDYSDRLLFAGLGVTESMLTGESSYSGERINIEIINNRYLLYRDTIQRYVHEKLFKPVAIRKGFYEYDEFGNKVVLYPKLSFTRLAVRDNRDTFDSLFNLYQKGSLSVDFILELMNIDPETVRERLERDLFTVNDATFNEAIRSILSDAGRGVIEQSDFTERFVEYLSKVSQFKINFTPPQEGGRF